MLVVDDSRAQRRVLGATLSRLGFSVTEAGSGEEALDILASQSIDLVLSDWMMPGMDGLELCRKFRELPRDSYGYFILLTSKSEKGAVAQGLDIGADDFLTKPVNPEELRARIAAGDRILRMERELNEKNRLVVATLEEISTLYDALDQDLVEARKMQQSLVRDRYRDYGATQVSLLLKPCNHVGGDLVGTFDAGGGRVAVYAIDVSGHGIASALLTARIAGYLSDGAPAQNIALIQVAEGLYRARGPAETAAELNTLMMTELQSDLYFTMSLAYIDQRTGRVDMTQCGHPAAAVLKADGNVDFRGDGGMPIGLVSEAEYESFSFTLDPGDRLVLYSDGFTECPNEAGEELEEDGFRQIMQNNAQLSGNEFLESLTWELDRFAGNKELPDDISCITLAYSPANSAK